MKKLITVFIMTMLFVATTATAQQRKHNKKDVHQQYVQVQLNEIREVLCLDSMTMAQFEPIYRQYHNDLNKQKRVHSFHRISTEELNEEEIEKIILERHKRDTFRAKTRETYYHEFRKILLPSQILKVYRLEAESREKMIQANKKRKKIK